MAKHIKSTEILKAVRRDSFTTVKSVADRTGVQQQVARRHLDKLVAEGSVEQISVKTTGKRGRPAKQYRRVATPVVEAETQAEASSTTVEAA